MGREVSPTGLLGSLSGSRRLRVSPAFQAACYHGESQGLAASHHHMGLYLGLDFHSWHRLTLESDLWSRIRGLIGKHDLALVSFPFTLIIEALISLIVLSCGDTSVFLGRQERGHWHFQSLQHKIPSLSPFECCALAKLKTVFACRHLSILIRFPCILTIQCRLFGRFPSPDFISYHLYSYHLCSYNFQQVACYFKMVYLKAKPPPHLPGSLERGFPCLAEEADWAASSTFLCLSTEHSITISAQRRLA